MAITRNLTLGTLGSRINVLAGPGPSIVPPAPAAASPAAPAFSGLASATSVAAPFSNLIASSPVVTGPPPAPAAPTNVFKPPIGTAFLADGAANLAVQPFKPPTIDPSLIIPILPIRPFLPQNRTTTQLANGAIAQLTAAAPPVVREAMNTAVNASIGLPSNLMAHLERFVRVGEVLNEVAARWSETTRGDFAKAFNNMDAAKLDVMDAIVSLAILNDPDLEAELRGENTPQTTDSDLLNRKVVWQSPPPGAPLEPPYIVMIAVEYTDTAKAQDLVKQITDQLVIRDNFRMPRLAADKL
jgi:hypothetical protein